jgi:hypothetical protein
LRRIGEREAGKTLSTERLCEDGSISSEKEDRTRGMAVKSKDAGCARNSQKFTVTYGSMLVGDICSIVGRIGFALIGVICSAVLKFDPIYPQVL